MKLCHKTLCTAIAALLCIAMTGCAEESGEGLWVSIEPTDSAEFGEPRYQDGTYLTQDVREPAADPYADDTQKISDGQTEDGILYAVYERHAEITGHTDDFDAEFLTVPSELGGKPVSRIASVAVSEENKFSPDESGAF